MRYKKVDVNEFLKSINKMYELIEELRRLNHMSLDNSEVTLNAQVKMTDLINSMDYYIGQLHKEVKNYKDALQEIESNQKETTNTNGAD